MCNVSNTVRVFTSTSGRKRGLSELHDRQATQAALADRNCAAYRWCQRFEVIYRYVSSIFKAAVGRAESRRALHLYELPIGEREHGLDWERLHLVALDRPRRVA